MKHYVYLAGPITGCTYDGCTDWRELVTRNTDNEKVECLSPLRGQQMLRGKGPLSAEGEYGATINSKTITRRDMFDATRASCVFVNLLGAKRVSIGTVMEIAWAYQKQIPVILVMEEGNVHEHAMVFESATYVVQTLEQATRIVWDLFNVVKYPQHQTEEG